jgi:hypothetical protein
MSKTHSASELAEAMGVETDVITSGDDAAKYLDDTEGHTSQEAASEDED